MITSNHVHSGEPIFNGLSFFFPSGIPGNKIFEEVILHGGWSIAIFRMVFPALPCPSMPATRPRAKTASNISLQPTTAILLSFITQEPLRQAQDQGFLLRSDSEMHPMWKRRSWLHRLLVSQVR